MKPRPPIFSLPACLPQLQEQSPDWIIPNYSKLDGMGRYRTKRSIHGPIWTSVHPDMTFRHTLVDIIVRGARVGYITSLYYIGGGVKFCRLHFDFKFRPAQNLSSILNAVGY